MRSRITIMLDNDIAKKLREVQAKRIKDTSEGVSFSKVINDILREAMKRS
jgi:uncharacterized protein (DUF4415 family)